MRMNKNDTYCNKKKKLFFFHSFLLLFLFLSIVIGQNMPASETCSLAVIASINYHQRKKHENNDVRLQTNYKWERQRKKRLRRITFCSPPIFRSPSSENGNGLVAIVNPFCDTNGSKICLIFLEIFETHIISLLRNVILCNFPPAIPY